MYSRVASPILTLATLGTLLYDYSLEEQQHAVDGRLRAVYTSEWKWRTEQLPNIEDGTRSIADHLLKVDPVTQEMCLRYWQVTLRPESMPLRAPA